MHEYDEEVNLQYEENMNGWDRIVRTFYIIVFVGALASLIIHLSLLQSPDVQQQNASPDPRCLNQVLEASPSS